MKSGLKIIPLIFFITANLPSCKSYEIITPGKIFNKVIQKFPATDTSTSLRLNSLLDFEWDHFIIIPSYTAEVISKKCGYNFSLPDSKNQHTEGGDEYVFLKNSKVIYHIINAPQKENFITIRYDFAAMKNDSNFCGIANSDKVYIKQGVIDSWGNNTFI